MAVLQLFSLNADGSVTIFGYLAAPPSTNAQNTPLTGGGRVEQYFLIESEEANPNYVSYEITRKAYI